MVSSKYTYFGAGYIAVVFLIVTLANPVSALALPITLIGPAVILYLTKKTYQESGLSKGVVIAALILGGGVCTFIAGIANTLAAVIIPNYLVTVVNAPLVEEGLKVFALYLLREAIKNPLQGVLIGLYIGAGFTVVEDVLYLANTTSSTEAFGTSFARLLFNPFMHLVCTAVVGLAYGRKKTGKGVLKALFVAIYLHSFWNLLAGTGLSIAWLYGVSYALALSYLLEMAQSYQMRKITEFKLTFYYQNLLDHEKKIIDGGFSSKYINTQELRNDLYSLIYHPCEMCYKKILTQRKMLHARTRYQMIDEINFSPLIPGSYYKNGEWVSY